MKVSMYSVFDMVAQQYGRPFCSANESVAIRSFSHEVNTPSDSVLFHSSSDFQLFMVGAFDDEVGVLIHLPAPVLVCSGSAVRAAAVASEARGSGNPVGSDVSEVTHG